MARRVVVGFKRAHDFEQFHFVDGIEEVHAHALLRAVSHAGNFRHAERRGIGSEDSCRAADFIEERENLDLRFHFLRDGLDDEIGFARGFLDRSRVLEPAECRIGVTGGDFVQLDRFIEIGADFRLRLAQSAGKQILENGAIPAKRSGVGDAAPHDSGADHGNRLDRRHPTFPPSRGRRWRR